ncbi:hypothetical protein [Paenibacillus soyae]|uniref:Uncharacterized protein n=1 Tax=Paenibacillus soyae TaxID=2969249 RepID=A0A9X2S869_9BACL|nr:hypothetical protein [Paenibacillus soyae]MCR2803766.1 hypothetical protein [Paenibacillus soyae]
MSKFRSKIYVSCLIAASLLLSAAYNGPHSSADAAASAVTQATDESKVKEQARIWVDELSAKARYASWKNAALSVSALGPGTHSWLVQLTNEKRDIIGYLVINALEEGGLQLGEYGTGSYPLFNEQSLQLSLLQLELIHYQAERVYADPLHAVWRITSKSGMYYTDGMSGEGLPIAKDSEWKKELGRINAKKHGVLASHAKLSTAYGLVDSFDPYARMPWLTKQPLKLEAPRYSALLQALNDKNELRYTTEAYKGKLRQVWSVVGYDLWNGDQLFLALDTDEDGADRRYIPVNLLLEQGKFYL